MKVAAICPVGAGVFHHRIDRAHTRMNALGYAECTIYNTYIEKIEDLKEYDLVIYHTGIVSDTTKMPSVLAKLKSWHVRVILDIDDHWEVNKTHALYNTFRKMKRKENVIMQMGMVDAVFAATPFLAKQAIKYAKSVYTMPNAIDFTERQFQPLKDSRLKNPDRVYYGLLTGSSHKDDVQLIESLWNPINSKYGDSVGTVIAGYNLGGEKRVLSYLSEDMINDLRKLGLYRRDVLTAIHKNKGRILKILPQQFREKYGNTLQLLEFKQPIPPKENVWYYYEQILTGNFNTITDFTHRQFLHQFKEVEYNNGDMEHIRVWTKPPTEYAKGYNTMDISLAPLKDNVFNRSKSNLKLLEAGAHKKAVIASDVEPYRAIHSDPDLWHGNKLFLVKEKRRRDWSKFLGKLLSNEQLRLDMGENLHEWVKENYDMDTVCERRADYYKTIIEHDKSDILVA